MNPNAMSTTEALQELQLHEVPEITPAIVKTAYRRLALSRHPDKGGSTEAMAQLNNAYAVIERNFDRAQALHMSIRSTPVSTLGDWRAFADALFGKETSGRTRR